MNSLHKLLKVQTIISIIYFLIIAIFGVLNFIIEDRTARIAATISFIVISICYLVYILNEVLRISSELANNNKEMAVSCHEINNMLSGVIGMSSLLEITQLDKEQKEYVDIMKVYSSNLRTLLNDIMLFSSMGFKKMILEKQYISVPTLVKQVCRPYYTESALKNITFSVNISDELNNYMICTDSVRLSQVIHNFLKNAFKFTSKGGVTVNAGINKQGDDFRVFFEIIDSGIGISKQSTAQIFQYFMQADTARENRYGGVGIGLAISKSIIELMGGNIALETEEGRGSKFTVVIPCKYTQIPQTAEQQ